MRNGRYLGVARRFLDAAKRELTQGKLNQDDTTLRQAAEKGWGAAVQATNALLARHGFKPKAGTQRKLDFLTQLEKRNPQVRAAGMYHRLNSALWELHIRGFYEGTYSLARIERQLRDLDQYITDAAQL